MNREIAEPRCQFGWIMLTVAGMMLAGCTASVPVQQPYTATVNVPYGWPYWNGGYYAPPAPPPVYYAPRPLPPRSPPQNSPFSMIVPSAEAQTVPAQPPPLRSIDPEPAAQPVDSSCGWWRLCNLWKGSGS